MFRVGGGRYVGVVEGYVRCEQVRGLLRLLREGHAREADPGECRRYLLAGLAQLVGTDLAGPLDAEARQLVELFFSEFGPLLREPEARLGRSAVRLAPRPRQALLLVLRGLGDKEIARVMGISKHTVNQYLKVIFTTLGVSSRAELISRWHAPG